MPSPITYPEYNFPSADIQFSGMDAHSPPHANQLQAPMAQTKAAMIFEIEGLKKKMKGLQDTTQTLENKVTQLEKERTSDSNEFCKLKKIVRTMYQRIQDEKAAAAAAAVAAAEIEEDSEDEIEERAKVISEAEREAIETSTEAANSNVLKVSYVLVVRR